MICAQQTGILCENNKRKIFQVLFLLYLKKVHFDDDRQLVSPKITIVQVITCNFSLSFNACFSTLLLLVCLCQVHNMLQLFLLLYCSLCSVQCEQVEKCYIKYHIMHIQYVALRMMEKCEK